MKISILLATHNGMRWLPQQVDSILKQQEVTVRLIVSDDASTDGTTEWLQTLSAGDARVTLLPPQGPYGSAARNFYRLIRDADFSDADFISFSDQDDVWHSDKLSRAVSLLKTSKAAAISTNVTAFWSDGCRRKLVNKAQPQQAYDYLFEAAGPGCTYVLSLAFAYSVRDQLEAFSTLNEELPAYHDWLCYALCRAQGKKWVIDALPSMEYRQHGNNEVGVNDGVQAGQARIRKIASGWYRTEVLRLARMGLTVRPHDRGLAHLTLRLQRGSWLDRLVLTCNVHRLRRRLRDRLTLAGLFLSGLFFSKNF